MPINPENFQQPIVNQPEWMTSIPRYDDGSDMVEAMSKILAAPKKELVLVIDKNVAKPHSWIDRAAYDNFPEKYLVIAIALIHEVADPDADQPKNAANVLRACVYDQSFSQMEEKLIGSEGVATHRFHGTRVMPTDIKQVSFSTIETISQPMNL